MKSNEQLIEQYTKMNQFENREYKTGKNIIVGVDEVGRGPLAGPMVVAGVVLDPKNPILGLNDSKKLSKKKRIELYSEICEKCIVYKQIFISAKEIDEKGLSICLNTAVNNLLEFINKSIPIDYVLLDFMYVNIDFQNEKIKKGDAKSNSIAAASILAKVIRDKYMEDIAIRYPEYKFSNNVGYGTREHLEAIQKYGIIKEVHRKSFEPIKSGDFKER